MTHTIKRAVVTALALAVSSIGLPSAAPTFAAPLHGNCKDFHYHSIGNGRSVLNFCNLSSFNVQAWYYYEGEWPSCQDVPPRSDRLVGYSGAKPYSFHVNRYCP